MRARLAAGAAVMAVTAAAALVARIAGGPDLGPVDGHDLAPIALDRVSVGDVAPDFALQALDGEIVRLSDYRGSQRVVLVFYRGHW